MTCPAFPLVDPSGPMFSLQAGGRDLYSILSEAVKAIAPRISDHEAAWRTRLSEMNMTAPSEPGGKST